MPRGRSAPAPARSSSSAASRPRPAASPAPAASSPPPRPQQPHGAPAPAPHAGAPPPAMPTGGSGGGFLSGMMGAVAQGMALGTGSAIAHRAVDSMMGPRETVVRHEGAPAAAPEAPAYSSMNQMNQMNPCDQKAKEFAECMSRSNGDMGACQFYFDAMNSCKMQYRIA